MSAHDYIAKAGILLRDKSNWTQGALARNRRGLPTCYTRGVSFDILGAVLHHGSQTESAIRRDGINNGMAAALGFVQIVARRQHKCSAEVVNDTFGHEAILNVLRQAWQMAKASASNDPFAD